MYLYLMQHGLALSKDEDPTRPLSPEGMAQIQSAASAIRIMDVSFDAIITSTKLRSRQTAELVADAVAFPVEHIQESELFDPKADPELAIDYLNAMDEEGFVFVAGHLPSLACIASILLSRHCNTDIYFENGGICCIKIDDPAEGDGQLRYLLTSEQTRLIGDKS